MSEENLNYDDFKKAADLWLEKNKQQQKQDSSEAANVILDQQYEAFFAEYQKAVTQGNLRRLKEITQQLQLLFMLRQQNL
jgi:predicted phage-related endonuclease